ncbi:hypothetical protein MAQ5080_01698 [Marinomonas aquimarina]|uniref:Uncharacterized protein n=1 Tax=Marinomonas aquimarina TaxID=295068 RepID=A0A1A8TC03_9GAMM|nr:hypothetical protein [Marinomonas aquimarina]SBS30532.1 hypothetical protein MAQ5080_01698 [Marinomonas aquimarina]
MKKLITLTSAALATAALSTSALADNITDDLHRAESRYHALAEQVESQGYQVDELYSEPMTTSQKLDVVAEKRAELINVLDGLNSAN